MKKGPPITKQKIIFTKLVFWWIIINFLLWVHLFFSPSNHFLLYNWWTIFQICFLQPLLLLEWVDIFYKIFPQTSLFFRMSGQFFLGLCNHPLFWKWVDYFFLPFFLSELLDKLSFFNLLLFWIEWTFLPACPLNSNHPFQEELNKICLFMHTSSDLMLLSCDLILKCDFTIPHSWKSCMSQLVYIKLL